MRIRYVSVTSDFRGNYLKCSCMKWKRRGHPCECIFRLIENTELPVEKKLDMSMIDVKFWKAFSAYFGDDTPIGRMLVDAHSQGFRGENYGIAISAEVLKSIRECAGECTCNSIFSICSVCYVIHLFRSIIFWSVRYPILAL